MDKIASISVDIQFTSIAHQIEAAQSKILNAIDVMFPRRVLVEQSPSVISICCGQCSHSLGEVVECIQSHILTLDCVESYRLSLGKLEAADATARLAIHSNAHPQDHTTSSETSSQTLNNNERISI